MFESCIIHFELQFIGVEHENGKIILALVHKGYLMMHLKGNNHHTEIHYGINFGSKVVHLVWLSKEYTSGF